MGSPSLDVFDVLESSLNDIKVNRDKYLKSVKTAIKICGFSEYELGLKVSSCEKKTCFKNNDTNEIFCLRFTNENKIPKNMREDKIPIWFLEKFKNGTIDECKMSDDDTKKYLSKLCKK